MRKLGILLVTLLFALSVAAQPGDRHPGLIGGGGGGVPGLVGSSGDDATQQFLYDLKAPLCAPRLDAAYYFRPIHGDDDNSGLSFDDAFRSFSKANEVCTGPRTECVFESGAAWSPLRFPLTSTSGVFVKGETVSYTNGSATLLDYDAQLSVGIFEDNLDPQSIDVGASTTGNFTLSYSFRTTSNIAFNASAATVEAALEALATIDDVSVSGVGSVGDPWIVEFISPPRPLFPVTGTDVSLDGTLTVHSTRLTDSTAITGDASGATATTGTVSNLISAISGWSTECEADELCFRLRASEPGSDWTVSFNSQDIAGTTKVFDLSAPTWLQVENVQFRRSSGDHLFDTTVDDVRLLALNLDAKEFYSASVLRDTANATRHRVWFIGGSVEDQGGPSTVTPQTRLFENHGGDLYLVSDGRYTRSPGADNNDTFMLADCNDGKDQDIYVIGPTVDGSEMRGNTGSPSDESVFRLHSDENCTSSIDIINTVVTSDDPVGTAIAVSADGTGTKVTNISNVTFNGFRTHLFYATASSNPEGGNVLRVKESVLDALGSGGLFLSLRDAATVNGAGSVLEFSNWIHNDDGQSADWNSITTTFDTLAAFLSDSGVAARVSAGDWSFSGDIDGVSPQWDPAFRCDPAKECFEAGSSGAFTKVFNTPLPSWVLCEELRSLRTTNRNIGAR